MKSLIKLTINSNKTELYNEPYTLLSEAVSAVYFPPRVVLGFEPSL